MCQQDNKKIGKFVFLRFSLFCYFFYCYLSNDNNIANFILLAYEKTFIITYGVLHFDFM